MFRFQGWVDDLNEADRGNVPCRDQALLPGSGTADVLSPVPVSDTVGLDMRLLFPVLQLRQVIQRGRAQRDDWRHAVAQRLSWRRY